MRIYKMADLEPYGAREAIMSHLDDFPYRIDDATYRDRGYFIESADDFFALVDEDCLLEAEGESAEEMAEILVDEVVNHDYLVSERISIRWMQDAFSPCCLDGNRLQVDDADWRALIERPDSVLRLYELGLLKMWELRDKPGLLADLCEANMPIREYEDFLIGADVPVHENPDFYLKWRGNWESMANAWRAGASIEDILA